MASLSTSHCKGQDQAAGGNSGQDFTITFTMDSSTLFVKAT